MRIRVRRVREYGHMKMGAATRRGNEVERGGKKGRGGDGKGKETAENRNTLTAALCRQPRNEKAPMCEMRGRERREGTGVRHPERGNGLAANEMTQRKQRKRRERRRECGSAGNGGLGVLGDMFMSFIVDLVDVVRGLVRR